MNKFRLNLILLVITAITRPSVKALKATRFLYRTAAASIGGFIGYEVFPHLLIAIPELFSGQAPAPLVLVVFSYLILLFAISLIFWKVSENCAIQLKNRFNIEP